MEESCQLQSPADSRHGNSCQNTGLGWLPGPDWRSASRRAATEAQSAVLSVQVFRTRAGLKLSKSVWLQRKGRPYFRLCIKHALLRECYSCTYALVYGRLSSTAVQTKNILSCNCWKCGGGLVFTAPQNNGSFYIDCSNMASVLQQHGDCAFKVQGYSKWFNRFKTSILPYLSTVY
jgi:hypothetical protein